MAFYQEDKEKRSTDLSSDSDNQQAYSTSYACHKVVVFSMCRDGASFFSLIHRVTVFTHSIKMVNLGVLLTWLEQWSTRCYREDYTMILPKHATLADFRLCL